MKSTTSAILLLASFVSAKHGVHEHLQALHRRHHEQAARSVPETAESGVEIRSAAPEKRQGQCAFPYSDGIVAVTPGSQNGGWAMSPNQPCTPGSYCPYACPPGEVMMQWDPSATTYSYPKSMVSTLRIVMTDANLRRMVVYIATTTATYRSRSLANRIARQHQATLALSTTAARRLPSARQSFLAMKPC